MTATTASVHSINPEATANNGEASTGDSNNGNNVNMNNSTTADAGNTNTTSANEGLTTWGASWRVLGLIVVGVAIAASLGFGAQFAVNYLSSMGIEGTLLIAAKSAIYALGAVIGSWTSWKIGKSVYNVVVRRLRGTPAAE